MVDAGVRKQLVRMRKGDQLAIGFQKLRYPGDPIVEQVRGLGKAPGLKLDSAFEINNSHGDGTRFDYRTGKTSRCPDARARGSLVLLTCTADAESPAQLLTPLYDFCEALDKPPHIWFHSRTAAPHWSFTISEARVRAVELAAIVPRCSGLEGRYYIDSQKLLQAIERLTVPPDKGGNLDIWGMIRVDAFHIYDKRPKPGGPQDWETVLRQMRLDWALAQRKMVSRIISDMKMDEMYFIMSGGLEGDRLREPLDDLARRKVYAAVLRDLKGDDSIHITTENHLSMEGYVHSVLTYPSTNAPARDRLAS